MDKVINGVKINIDVDFWEAVEFGKTLNKNVVSKTSEQIDEQEKVIANKIKAYNSLIRRLPKPLYDFEGDIKYATIGQILKGKYIVKKGLHIQIVNTVLSLRGNVWGVAKGEVKGKARTIEDYQEDVGYREFKIWLDNLENKNANMYLLMFQDIYNACKGKKEDIEYIIENIMDSAKVGDRLTVDKNEMIDIRNNDKYKLSFYYDGTKEVENKIKCIDLTQKGKISECNDVIDIYRYEVYKQKIKNGEGHRDYGKMVKIEDMFIDIYATAVKLKIFEVRGIMKDENDIYFEIGQNVYHSNGIKSEMIIRNGSLYGIQEGNIIIESKEERENLLKCTRYIYNENGIRIGNIVYENQ